MKGDSFLEKIRNLDMPKEPFVVVTYDYSWFAI